MTSQLDVRLLGAKEILETNDVKTVDVDVPEWGGVVRLRTMTALEAIQFADQSKKQRDGPVQLLILTAIDAEGKQLFSAEHDVAQLRKKSMRALYRVQREAMKLNGLDEMAKETEAAKND